MPKETSKQSPDEGGDLNLAGESPDGEGSSDLSDPKKVTDDNAMAVRRAERRAARTSSRALVKRTVRAPAVPAPALPASGGGTPPIIPATASLAPFPPIGQRPSSPKRLRSTFWSAAIFVGIPTFLAILYFGVIASDQFASHSDFIIKTRSNTPSVAAGGMMGAVAPVNPMTIVDMLVVKEYVESAQILKDIEPQVDVRKLYSTPEADSFARLKEKPNYRRLLNGKVWSEGLFAPVTEEELLRFWNKMVVVNFDMTTGISTLEVRAFTRDDAKNLADAVLSLSERLVNQLSERAQSDSLTFARKEVEDANKRAVASLDELMKFQEVAKQLDPESYAKVRGEIQGKLEGDLAQNLAQLETLRKNLPDNAPGILQLKNRIAALQEQLLIQKLESTKSPSKGSANELLNEFSKRKLESDFATKLYMSALTSLETARRDATQQSRYLEAFVRPQKPQQADYPKRLQSVAIVFLGSAAIWAIGGLLIAAAKEHL
jgi:capsular polysaccharide transport system permease protein